MFAQNDDNIILKVDIEGAEYAIFDRLFETGLLSRVSSVYIELHEYKLTRNIEFDYRLLSQLQQYNIPLYSGSPRIYLQVQHCLRYLKSILTTYIIFILLN